jgi:4-alpha-glucanotransferase
MAPLQDLLNLGREARMNIPGRPEGNWSWRCTEDMLSNGDFEWLRDLTKNSNRLGTPLDFPTGKMLKAGSRT